jgi:transglutaminase-like putative cysteine protease
MFYTVSHTTKFHYSIPISENIMEIRLRPRHDDHQICLSFNLSLRPTARLFSFRDHLENVVHYFSSAAAHRELIILAEAVVQVHPPSLIPETLPATSWDDLNQIATEPEFWDMLEPSFFTPFSPAVHQLAQDLGISRETDPLTAVRILNCAIYTSFTYDADSTTVDSEVDEVIAHRHGVCQDYTHVALALTRAVLRIPCRYVSGYLFHREDDRSADDAMHAWFEVYLPELGWVGFDPTNNVLAGERHIRIAIGRDYSDVPPTRGVFKGNAESELHVSVQVKRVDGPLPPLEMLVPLPWDAEEPAPPLADTVTPEQQQQQQ